MEKSWLAEKIWILLELPGLLQVSTDTSILKEDTEIFM